MFRSYQGLLWYWGQGTVPPPVGGQSPRASRYRLGYEVHLVTGRLVWLVLGRMIAWGLLPKITH